GRTPHLSTHVSMAARLCQIARDTGVELRGAQFSVSGEPLTARRAATIREMGATAVPTYLSTEAGVMGYGCLVPSAPDEVHQRHDLVAMIQGSPDARPAAHSFASSASRPGPSDGALWVTSLRPAAPMVLLNLALGDAAIVSRRECGCPLEEFGWTTHLRRIRS